MRVFVLLHVILYFDGLILVVLRVSHTVIARNRYIAHTQRLSTIILGSRIIYADVFPIDKVIEPRLLYLCRSIH